MAENKNPDMEKEPKAAPVNEIDEFAQKLLDKKVELALFPDDDDITSQSLEGSMSEAQRKTAETSMLNALDQLRKERGQSTIEEEEASYRSRYGDQDDLDSAPEKKPAETDPQQEDDTYLSVEPNRYETVHREDHFEKSEKRPQKSGGSHKKIWIIAAIVAILAALFAGYVWKTTVYDPAHQSDPEQTEAYDRLVNFADEYSMMSDAQKKDIVKLEADYNSLPEARKTEINEYFQNPKHTGQSFTDLLAATKQNQLLAENPGMQELLSYASSYNSLEQAGKDDIINRLDAYNALNDEAKSQVNTAFSTATGKDFMTLYNETRARLDAASAQPADQPVDDGQAPVDGAQAGDPSSQAELQAQLEQLQIDRQNYVAFLESEGMPVEGDEILASYDAQIAQISAALDQ